MMEIDAHQEELDTENSTPNEHDKEKKPAKRRPTITTMPSASTIHEHEDSEADIDDDVDDNDVCCVCDQRQPSNMNDRPTLKILIWGNCDVSFM
ncbi:hypothetical protein DPMN_091079 [Dreissena polymorpha]|uniref:Uncharacterized protein n=1 Tax=Dreissena polymorpha TaxID=45954 RepID=A0A9D4QYW7_DREPO|nr:hypothetical protein DPMN_091079 [Dreissena polymorpha]